MIGFLGVASVGVIKMGTTEWSTTLLWTALSLASTAASIRAVARASVAVLVEAALRLAVGVAVAMMLCLFAIDSGAVVIASVAGMGVVAAFVKGPVLKTRLQG